MIELLEQMNKVNLDDKVKFFYERTDYHIELVQAAVEKIVRAYPELSQLFVKAGVHDASKYEEPERTPYIELTWLKKQGERAKGEIQDQITQATLHHVLNNSHHPEYHLENKTEANISSSDRDKSDRCVDASKMDYLSLAEMVADWVAMSQELKTNTARQWYDNVRNVRWSFSSRQENFIDSMLAVFE